MKNDSSLEERVAIAFKQALREQRFAVAELMLQALEHMNSECRCKAILDDALLTIDTPRQAVRPAKRRIH